MMPTEIYDVIDQYSGSMERQDSMDIPGSIEPALDFFLTSLTTGTFVVATLLSPASGVTVDTVTGARYAIDWAQPVDIGVRLVSEVELVYRGRDERVAVATLQQFITDYAFQRGIIAEITGLRRVEKTEEAVDQIFVTQRVDLEAGDALEYWDAVGAAIEAWLPELPLEIAAIVRSAITVDVAWPDRGV